ncbi:hypothetical protein BDC45DRAFT_273977 [Circinella umbellata]|nr:hypothetical protein BDC45DRAFT_273977 [Circinella umbellata]
MSKLPEQKPTVDERLQEKFKRRITTPESLAPNLRSRQIHLLTWAIAIRKGLLFVYLT